MACNFESLCAAIDAGDPVTSTQIGGACLTPEEKTVLLMKLAGIGVEDPSLVEIETSELRTCYQNAAGEKVSVEVIRDENNNFLNYTLHAISGTTDATDLSSLVECPPVPVFIDIPLCNPNQ